MSLFSWLRSKFERGGNNNEESTPVDDPTSSSDPGNTPVTSTDQTPTPVTSIGVPSIALGTISCENEDQTKMLVASNQILNQALASDEYKKQFLAFPFVQTNGMTNQELYDLFVSKSPVVMNLDLHDMGWRYDHVYHTIGLDDSSDPTTVYLNAYYVAQKIIAASCTLHETWHFLGLSHLSPSDSTSVPYGNNTIIEAVFKVLGITND